MSDAESSSDQNSAEFVTAFKCRLCPGSSFTPAEMDRHRSMHVRNGDCRSKSESRKKKRDSSPIPSSARTIFEEIDDDEDRSEDEKNKKPRRESAKSKKPQKKKKTHLDTRRPRIKPTHNYNDNVTSNLNDGG